VRQDFLLPTFVCFIGYLLSDFTICINYLLPGGTPLVLESSCPTNLNSTSPGMGRTPGLCMVANEKGPVAGLSPSRLNKLPLVAPMSRQHTRQHSISAVYDTSIGSQEQIAEKAKQVS
jgi:hypothetical protein